MCKKNNGKSFVKGVTRYQLFIDTSGSWTRDVAMVSSETSC